MQSYRKTTFTMERGSGYGQYIIRGMHRGKALRAHTTDSEAWDYLNDDSDKERHQSAKRHCYYKLVEAYVKTL